MNEYSWQEYCNRVRQLEKRVKALEQQTGHWIDMDEWLSPFLPCECSECKAVEFEKSKYCPNCGAKMVELQKGANE
jgi:hypothetical protein